MISKYKVEYLHRYGMEDVTERDPTVLEKLLNDKLKDGWELHSLTNTSIGFLLVFRYIPQPQWIGRTP